MKRVRYAGKKYFYALGQSVRARGLTKEFGMSFFKIDQAQDYARIAYDAGYRGLAF
jgi:hypothetical protein